MVSRAGHSRSHLLQDLLTPTPNPQQSTMHGTHPFHTGCSWLQMWMGLRNAELNRDSFLNCSMRSRLSCGVRLAVVSDALPCVLHYEIWEYC